MNTSPLFFLLKSLNKKAIRDLSKWLKSPFFNQRKDVIDLFDFLRKRIVDPNASINKQIAFQSIFKNEAYDDAKMRHTMSFLHQQIKDYLAYDYWKNKPFEKFIASLSSLRQQDQETPFRRSAFKLQEQFQKTENFTHLRHFHIYQVNLEQYRNSLKKSRTDASNLQEVSNSLTTFYICETLRIACLMLAHQTVNPQTKYEPQMLEDVLRKSKEANYISLPEVAIYYNTYYALLQPSEIHFFKKLKLLLTTHWQRFAKDEMRDIYLLVINYCIKKLNKGQQEFIKEALDLYKVGLDKEILFENNELSRFTYNNVLTLSLMLGDFEWASIFLETYKPYLPTRSRNNIYLYNLTIYHFKKQDYQKVMELLQQVQFRDVLYNLDSRRMLLRSYFELGEFDALDSLLDSFQVFIRRRHDLGYHKENFLNLIKFIKKLQTIGHQKTARMQLIKKIETTSAVADKEWLLEKIKALD